MDATKVIGSTEAIAQAAREIRMFPSRNGAWRIVAWFADKRQHFIRDNMTEQHAAQECIAMRQNRATQLMGRRGNA